MSWGFACDNVSLLPSTIVVRSWKVAETGPYLSSLANFTHCTFRSLTSARCCNYSYMCSWWWVELPPETRRAVYRNIKKLYKVASWTIIDIYSRCTDPLILNTCRGVIAPAVLALNIIIPCTLIKLCVLKVVARMIFQFSYQKRKSIIAACTQSLKLKILLHPHQIQLSCHQEPC
jgi:hypothetical protein